MWNFHDSFMQMPAAGSCARYPITRVMALCAVGFASALFVGCGELEPMREPEVVDLQLTTDTLRTSVRDAQRVVAELRTDLEVRRRDLSEAQVARAQLEGRVREAERRVIEARHVHYSRRGHGYRLRLLIFRGLTSMRRSLHRLLSLAGHMARWTWCSLLPILVQVRLFRS